MKCPTCGSEGYRLALELSGPGDPGTHPGFLQFWAAYPRKTGKKAAAASWNAKRPPLERCLQTITWQRSSEQWLRGFIPHPATWINQGRWDDEPDNGPKLTQRGAEHMRVISNTFNNIKDKL